MEKRIRLLNSYDCLHKVDHVEVTKNLMTHVMVYCLLQKSIWHNPSTGETCLANIQLEALRLGDY